MNDIASLVQMFAGRDGRNRDKLLSEAAAFLDIVERLRFDAIRCEVQFSKGVAGNIEEAAAEIGRLRAQLAEAAAFLDALAGRIENWPPGASRYQFQPTAADCREMARKLRGET